MILKTAFFKNRTTGEVHKLQMQLVNNYHMALADLKASMLVSVIVKEHKSLIVGLGLHALCTYSQNDLERSASCRKCEIRLRQVTSLYRYYACPDYLWRAGTIKFYGAP